MLVLVIAVTAMVVTGVAVPVAVTALSAVTALATGAYRRPARG
ncbi:hypothetical protein BC739_007031 [Kutzneria viridogrisea]|uniref:Uncharacterized protein n=1 Tax=Kutzneria viridogrisea TaxID=47990 RepID=A0ABR6BSK3_9PSEU|nr:hypothetical protein [Kutzneria albida]MBA8929798.1 hypothetical protein [Kutzneria viridogrisea]